MATISEFRALTCKDVETLMEVSETSAKRILKDIKEDLKCPKVLFCHFKQYFKVPN